MRIARKKIFSDDRGLTLVELMVAVAIVGILAAIGSVAYGRYIKQGKVTKLKQVALEVASGQERYRSRNNAYFNPTGDFATEPAKYQNLLDFGGNTLPANATVTTEGWAAGGNCSVCAAESITVDTTKDGFIVVVKQNLDPSDANDTTAYVTRNMQDPVILFEGT